MREIKYIYTIVKPKITFSSRSMTIEEIENGDAKTFLEMNGVLHNYHEIHRRALTGLLDSKGVEIWEGDILEYTYNRDTQTKTSFKETVEWDDDMKDYSGYTIHKGMTYDVVGNIYENKNLYDRAGI